MRLIRTKCCALLFLQYNYNDDINELYKKLLKKQKKINQTDKGNYGHGETTVQIMLSPYERDAYKMDRSLKKIGFKEVCHFPRRRVTCGINPAEVEKKDQLTMMVLKLTDLKAPNI